MLVVNEEHNHTLGTKAHVPGSSCALCQESIYFPVIVGIDRNQTSYHPGCAAQVAQALLSDVLQLLLSGPGPTKEE